MALVCDAKSEPGQAEPADPKEENEDLEDGEIEDDDEEPQPPENPPQPANVSTPSKNSSSGDSPRARDRSKERRKHESGKKHMTEAERSILHLRKKEKMERDKWLKFQRDRQQQVEPQDDFAKHLEKTLATILKKEKSTSGEDEKTDEDKRGCKRKRKNKHDPNKLRKKDSSEDYDEIEQLKSDDNTPKSERSCESEYSSEQDNREETQKNIRKKNKNNRPNKPRNKNFNNKQDNRNKFKETKEMKGVCLGYLHGTCNNGPNDCQFSHDAMPQMKLEVCKFYVMDRCMKGENCTYMHEKFPCKFYHAGLQCQNGENCKFAHGKPLTDGLKRLLLKHIETAPVKMMAGFPKVDHDELAQMLGLYRDSLTYPNEEEAETPPARQPGQCTDIPSLFDVDVPVPYELQQLGGSQLKDKKDRPVRKSRWNNPEPSGTQQNETKGFEPFPFNQDLDMRINSNGDTDMRTLPPHPLTSIAQPLAPSYPPNVNYPPPTADMDIRNQTFSSDVDIRLNRGFEIGISDLDIRNLKPEDVNQDTDIRSFPKEDVELAPTQRELYARIQAQQKDAPFQTSNAEEGTDPERSQTPVDTVNWYSDEEEDDDDMPKLTINDPLEEKKEDEPSDVPAPYDPRADLMKKEKIDVSKINITADITKLLSSLSQAVAKSPKDDDGKNSPKDPRLGKSERQDPRLVDPRRRRSSAEAPKASKVSIYDQGPEPEDLNLKMDQDEYKASRSDVDLRPLQLPLSGLRGSAGLENYTPATEIDASFSSHSPIAWRVSEVFIPRPDYAGLRLSVADAEKTGDPRLRKLFRLSVDEKDSPASPEREPAGKEAKARSDPRLRRAEADKDKSKELTPDLSYKQQLSMLQSSAFYQSLTSNQKVMLNQELAMHSDQSDQHDPLLNSLLTNLNLLPGAQQQQQQQPPREIMPPQGPPMMNQGPPPNVQVALSILQNIGKLNPIANGLLGAAANNPGLLNQMAQSIVQPGLLGAAPGVPNLGQDFPPFDPRNQNGLLGNPPFHQPYDQPPDNFEGYDDFYPPDMHPGGPPFMGPQRMNRDGRNNFNRDRRRGNNRNFGGNNRNQGRNFRLNRNNNRNNRNQSPA